MKVYICGESYGSIDGLWKDYKNHKYSLAQTALLSICQLNCKNHSSANIDIIHVPYAAKHPQVRIRKEQKFKIMSISSCYISDLCLNYADNVKLKIL